MFNFIKRLFNKPKQEIKPEQVMDDEAIMREMVARAWNSKKMVIGNVENGKLIIEEIEIDSQK